MHGNPLQSNDIIFLFSSEKCILWLACATRSQLFEAYATFSPRPQHHIPLQQSRAQTKANKKTFVFMGPTGHVISVCTCDSVAQQERLRWLRENCSWYSSCCSRSCQLPGMPASFRKVLKKHSISLSLSLSLPIIMAHRNRAVHPRFDMELTNLGCKPN